MIKSLLSIVSTVKEGIVQTTTASFGVAAMAFLQNSVSHMIPWFLVTFAVILTDLITGIRKSVYLGEKVRISSAVRRTLGKSVVYFSWVMMVCMICVASGEQYGIDKWSCLLVCLIEGISIFGNIMRTKGYEIDFAKALSVLFSKKFGGDKKDYEDIIEKKGEEE